MNKIKNFLVKIGEGLDALEEDLETMFVEEEL